MGTRAAFFIGDFRDTAKREWLGCVAWDGYPDGLPEVCAAKSEQEFRDAVAGESNRDDFAAPTGPFPYPWQDDLCLTDCTYTWYEGEVWFEWDRRMVPLARAMEVFADPDDEAEQGVEAKLKADYPVQDCYNIPAPGKPYDGTAPDSIMIFSVRR